MKEKIILGLGNNIDYEILWDSGVIENMITLYGIRDSELSSDIGITSERELVVSILGFLKAGGGGERFVSSTDIIESFARNFRNKITLGGTSVRAAIAMRRLGYTSALHLVTVNDTVRRLIPRDSPYVCSNTKDTWYPHLIVQFRKNTRVRAGGIDICAGRANRIIYNNDYDNIAMKINEELSGLITEAGVFLISGLNAMQSRELLEKRLQTLKNIIKKLPKDALVYYEDACFYDVSFSRLIHSALADSIDIYSLNEDELQLYVGRKLDFLDPHKIKEALEDMQKLLRVPCLVVHTRYWALAYGANATSYSQALKGGIAMATTRFRFGDDFRAEDYTETQGLRSGEEGAVFADGIKKLLGDKICCAPALEAEETNTTTVGLGDSFVGGFLPALL